MDPIWMAAGSVPVLLLLIFLRVPIGMAMLSVGLVGSWQVYGSLAPQLNQMKTMAYSQFSSNSLSIVPLFLLMGQFAGLGGMSKALFKAAEAFLGHRKGGLAMAAIGACAGFGSICGSSLATAATMAQVALPELKRAGYANSLATGALAAFEIAVAGGGAALAGLEPVGVHRQAHAAAGLAPLEAGGPEHLVQPFLLGLSTHLLRTGDDERSDSGRDFAATHHLRRFAKIGNATVRTRADECHVDLRPANGLAFMELHEVQRFANPLLLVSGK